MDAKAQNIIIKMPKENDKHFIPFHNYSIPMIKEEFVKNH